jgi:hypothetical protein
MPDASDAGEPITEIMRRRLEEISTGHIVPEKIAQHCDNLTRLAESLRNIGMHDREVNEHVLGIFREYEQALVRSLLDAGKIAGKK